jgi:hypothetical protein
MSPRWDDAVLPDAVTKSWAICSTIFAPTGNVGQLPPNRRASRLIMVFPRHARWSHFKDETDLLSLAHAATPSEESCRHWI